MYMMPSRGSEDCPSNDEDSVFISADIVDDSVGSCSHRSPRGRTRSKRIKLKERCRPSYGCIRMGRLMVYLRCCGTAM